MSKGIRSLRTLMSTYLISLYEPFKTQQCISRQKVVILSQSKKYYRPIILRLILPILYFLPKYWVSISFSKFLLVLIWSFPSRFSLQKVETTGLGQSHANCILRRSRVLEMSKENPQYFYFCFFTVFRLDYLSQITKLQIFVQLFIVYFVHILGLLIPITQLNVYSSKIMLLSLIRNPQLMTGTA